MGAVDRDVVRARLGRVLHEIDAIERSLPAQLEAYTDPAYEDLRYALEHRLFVATQAMLDVAAHIAVSSDYPKLDSYADALDALGKLGVVESVVVEKLRGAAGLRNAIAHGYLELDQAMVYEALRLTDEVRSFAAGVWDGIESRGGQGRASAGVGVGWLGRFGIVVLDGSGPACREPLGGGTQGVAGV